MNVSSRHRRVVVALGGNAITRPGEEGTVEQDFANLESSLEDVVHLVELGYEVVITHGNGPQVGNQMIRVELARGQAPDLPLDVMGADIQGGLGYMIERVLREKLRRKALSAKVCCMLSMVEVNWDDPAMGEPTKFVGPFFEERDVESLRSQRGWVVKEDKGRGWRRVVPSPEPIGLVESQELLTLIEAGCIVISGGGGGVPVARDERGNMVGVEGVIDKDFASTVIALAIGASELFILTGVEKVKLGFGTPEERDVDRLSVREARGFLSSGEFPAGSMGPKIDAACRFVEGGGGRVLITDIFALRKALEGRTGTWIVAD